jgi:hypothetical protein
MLLSGCSSAIKFSATKKVSVTGASVVKRSDYPTRDQVIIYTFGNNLAGVLGGAIGAAAVAGAGSDDRSQFAAYLHSQKIDPGIIMAQAFDDELKKAPLWPASRSTSDAAFEFKIGIVGLMIRHGLTTKLSPYLVAEGKLVRRDGSVLWKRTSYVRDAEIRHSLEEYLQQPPVLRRALEAAARTLSQDFLEELHDDSGSS